MQRVVSREGLLHLIVERIASQHTGLRPIVVGVDGIDGAGKTTLVSELAAALEAAGNAPVCASIDGFHRPRAERVARGALSPVGYYEDSFDYRALMRNFLQPLRTFERPCSVVPAVFDYRSDTSVEPRPLSITPTSVILFEGVFLFRPELIGFWDLRLFLSISFETSLRRGMERDADRLGGATSAREKYEQRYIPGQRIYLERVHPQALAHVVINNENPNAPVIYETSSSLPNTSAVRETRHATWPRHVLDRMALHPDDAD